MLWKQNVFAVFCWDKVIFFLVADKVLCFGIVTKPVLTVHQCFRCCWAQLAQYLTLFCFSCCPTSEEAESWGDAARTAGTRLTKGMSIPYDFVLGIKSWEKGGGWGAFRVTALVFPKELLGVMEPAFLEMGGNWEFHGNWGNYRLSHHTTHKKRWWYVGKNSHFSLFFFFFHLFHHLWFHVYFPSCCSSSLLLVSNLLLTAVTFPLKNNGKVRNEQSALSLAYAVLPKL